MSEDPITLEAFFRIHSGLPREGPGDRASTHRAADALRDVLPGPVRAVDMGCGPGAQTLDLMGTPGLDVSVIGIDTHRPFLVEACDRIRQAGRKAQARFIQADMARAPLRPASVDLVWSESAAYSIGLEAALRCWAGLLRPGGAIAFTELVWCEEEPPAEVAEFFAAEYPDMRHRSEIPDLMERAGYGVLSHFDLPESAWWDGYYAPISAKLPALRNEYADHPGALAAIDAHEQEIAMRRRFPDAYAYTFYLGRRSDHVSA